MHPGTVYRNTQVNTASPLRLVLLVLEAAQTNVNRAITAVGRGDVPGSHHAILRAQEAVQTLRAALDFRFGEIASQLDAIYDFILRLLVQANLKKSEPDLQVALNLLRELHQTWSEVGRQLGSENSGPRVERSDSLPVRGGD